MHRTLRQSAGLCDVYFPSMSLIPFVHTWGSELEVHCCRTQVPDPKEPTLNTSHSTSKGHSENKVEEKCKMLNVEMWLDVQKTDWWTGLERRKKKSQYSWRVLVKWAFEVRENENRRCGMSWKIVAGSLPPQKNIFSHSNFTTQRDPFIGLGRSWGRNGRRNIEFGFRGLRFKSWFMYVAVGKSVRLCLFSLSCETGQRIHALADCCVALTNWWIWNSFLNWRAFYKYLIRNILHCVHI